MRNFQAQVREREMKSKREREEKSTPPFSFIIRDWKLAQMKGHYNGRESRFSEAFLKCGTALNFIFKKISSTNGALFFFLILWNVDPIIFKCTPTTL